MSLLRQLRIQRKNDEIFSLKNLRIFLFHFLFKFALIRLLITQVELLLILSLGSQEVPCPKPFRQICTEIQNFFFTCQKDQNVSLRKSLVNLGHFGQGIFNVILLGYFIIVNIHLEGSYLDVDQRRSFGEDLWVVKKVCQPQSGRHDDQSKRSHLDLLDLIGIGELKQSLLSPDPNHFD